MLMIHSSEFEHSVTQDSQHAIVQSILRTLPERHLQVPVSEIVRLLSHHSQERLQVGVPVDRTLRLPAAQAPPASQSVSPSNQATKASSRLRAQTITASRSRSKTSNQSPNRMSGCQLQIYVPRPYFSTHFMRGALRCMMFLSRSLDSAECAARGGRVVVLPDLGGHASTCFPD